MKQRQVEGSNDLAYEEPDLSELAHRHQVRLFGAGHPELCLPSQPPIQGKFSAHGVVNRDVPHHHPSIPLFVPAAQVAPARGPGHDHGDSVEIIVAGVEDEAAHAQ